ncbi:hypothetical protein [Nonlabens sp. SY33080]|uniref:hypothetical protein n=1 Tax=Nonlabens sp. SY33080 TaxID=2719911 RepID=UPI001428B404|nr:hypothetical protein [Nonlabens sp. SY33080]
MPNVLLTANQLGIANVSATRKLLSLILNGILKVTYENGEVKEIQDYGLQGTINLNAIYKKMFEINKNVK